MIPTATPGHYRPESLRAARSARGWTKQKLIHALRRAAAERGVTLVADPSLSRAIAGWENGHHYPTQYVELLTAAYGQPAHTLGLSEAPPTAQVPDPDYPATTTDAVAAVTGLWRADLNPHHGTGETSLDITAWRSASLGWLVAPDREPLPAPRAHTHVGMGDVQTVKTTVEMFVELDNRFGGGHARRALIQYLDGDVSALLAARYTDVVGRALFATVAEGTLLAAWMSYDSAHHGLAQRYFVQALRLAQAADDRRLAASVLSAMSHQATYLGKYREAGELARAAILGVRDHATPTLLAQFRAMEARALARAGDQTGCSTALAEASKSFEAHNPGDDPEWINYFDEAELAAEFGHCFRDLGQARQATSYAEQSLSGTNVRSDFFATMVLADSFLGQDEPEQACAIAIRALNLGAQLKSARCVSYLGEFRTRLDTHADHPAVRDFHEQARTSRLWQQTG